MLESRVPAEPRLVGLTQFLDVTGNLVIAEISGQLPFVATRVFVISGVPEGQPRGIHAHRVCAQFLICVSGSVRAMVDNGDRREVLLLDSPAQGLFMPPMTWGTQYDYSPDAVLLVLASHIYDADDYIHDYDEFLRLTSEPFSTEGQK
jgi:UDP-2-acetamido-3-amino-2,3-dideoxy-glucuronate N-acetyltransferase